MKRKQALIDWIAKEDGGRSKPPTGVGSPSYAAEVRFVDGGATWSVQEGWSLVVTKHQELGSEYRWMAEVHFLVKDAPHESLREGRTFELYEGNRCVARGRILAPNEKLAALLAQVTNMHVS